jgi:RHS repeat-associated protein
VGTHRYVYDDQGRLLGEYDSSSGYSQETVWFNNQPVATIINGVTYYVNADNIGAPRSIVRASDNVEMWRWDSDPFGHSTPTAPNPSAGTITYNLRFPGQVAGIGYYYLNGARDYNAVTGRYLEPDPSGLRGGPSRYAYAAGNPVSVIDPSGLDPHSYTWSVFRCMGNCTGQSFYELTMNPAPSVMLSQPVKNGAVNLVSVGSITLGQIVTAVDPVNLSITNYTLQDHMLYPGSVTRTVVFDGSSTWIVTTGAGDGPMATVNDVLAPLVWGGTSPAKQPICHR